MKFITRLSLLGLGLLSSVSAQAVHEHDASCLLSDEQLSQIKALDSSHSALRGVSRTSACEAWACYAGEGTEESPYIITVGAYVSEASLQDFSTRAIEQVMIEGVANFNQGLINSNIKTVKITFEQLVIVPESDYAFSSGSISTDLVGWANCDDCYEVTLQHGNDLNVVFHPYPDNTGTRGVAGGYISAINLSGGLMQWANIPLTIPHEIGHMFGAGHQLGAATSGAQHAYSNAVGCEDEQGNRASSIVSTWEKESRILQFSSPDMDCGTSDTDNRRTILEIAQRKGAYREIPEALGSVRVEVPTDSINEGESFEITVIRDGDINSVAFVGLWVEGDALQKGNDYTYITFDEGEDTVNVTIESIHDSQWSESSKALAIQLDYPTALSVSGSVHTVEVLNIDDKQSGIVGFLSAELLMDKGEQNTLSLTRLEGADGSITVNVVMENPSEAGKYFTLSAETVTFEDGEALKTIDIVALDDGMWEENITFTLLLTGDGVGNTSTKSITIESNVEDKIVIENDSESSGGGIGFVTLLFGLFLSVKRLKS